MGNKTILKLGIPKLDGSPSAGQFDYLPKAKEDEVSEL
jgi:hypothetical protein